MHIIAEYFDDEAKFRAVRLTFREGEDIELLLPFRLREVDKRFSKVRKWYIEKPKQGS